MREVDDAGAPEALIFAPPGFTPDTPATIAAVPTAGTDHTVKDLVSTMSTESPVDALWPGEIIEEDAGSVLIVPLLSVTRRKWPSGKLVFAVLGTHSDPPATAACRGK